MKLSCAQCQKAYEIKSKGVAHRLRENHFCSKECFSKFSKTKHYFLKMKKKGKHKDLMEDLEDTFERNSLENEFA